MGVRVADADKHRRSIRLRGADYTEAGAYLVTICASERHSIFGKVVDGRVLTSSLGKICGECLLSIHKHFAHASVKEFAVMPNHLHAILIVKAGARYIVPGNRGMRTPERFQKPVVGSVPTIVRTFKAAVTRRATRELKWEGKEIWQRNYFERVLRDGKEYALASRYVSENPQRWEWDRNNLERRETEIKDAKAVGESFRETGS
jgi:putative transposase